MTTDGDARRTHLGQTLVYLWRLSRPEAWMVSILPMYVGWVLATRELAPGLAQWASFWAGAVADGRNAAEFLYTLEATVLLGFDLIVAIVVMGPLIWAATLLINDAYDLPGDRLNPRKARSPLVQGFVSAGFARKAAYGFALVTLAVAWLVNVSFFLLVLANLGLAWAYSVPPVRLKTRPGMDLFVNAVGIGLVSALAGWSIARPVVEFPFVFAGQGLLVAAAIYVPTTLVDHEADEEAGYLTLATHLGPRRAYWVGFGAWVACNVGAIAFSVADVIIPRAMLPLLVIFCPLLVWEYHMFIGRARTAAGRIEGIILTSLTFLAVNLVFALMYTGLWAV